MKISTDKKQLKRQVHNCNRGKCLRINRTTGEPFCKNRFPRPIHTEHHKECPPNCVLRTSEKWIY
eukprot:UN15978